MVFDIDNEAKRVLPTTWGDFPLVAFIKHQPEDFQVREELGFEPEGSGEHLLVKVRKSELNTIEVAASLAHHAEVRPGEVSYSGLKDRNALTEQWFSIWLGKRPDPDWTIFNRPNCTVITASRHRRKLRRGSHKGNHFRIILRQATGDFETAQSRFNQITERGIPNYFGEQRFGHRRKNLFRAEAMFVGRSKIRGRYQRGLVLSAARSWLFNRVLGERVDRGSWNRALEGEVVMLDGSRSVFPTEGDDATIAKRIAALDIHPTGPLCGRGIPRTTRLAFQTEESILSDLTDWRRALEETGLRAERRALRIRPRNPGWERDKSGDPVVEFTLGRGEYATSLLREIIGEGPPSDRNRASDELHSL